MTPGLSGSACLLIERGMSADRGQQDYRCDRPEMFLAGRGSGCLVSHREASERRLAAKPIVDFWAERATVLHDYGLIVLATGDVFDFCIK